MQVFSLSDASVTPLKRLDLYFEEMELIVTVENFKYPLLLVEKYPHFLVFKVMS